MFIPCRVNEFPSLFSTRCDMFIYIRVSSKTVGWMDLSHCRNIWFVYFDLKMSLVNHSLVASTRYLKLFVRIRTGNDRNSNRFGSSSLHSTRKCISQDVHTNQPNRIDIKAITDREVSNESFFALMTLNY